MEKDCSSLCGDSEASEIERPSGQEQHQPCPSQRIDGIPSNRGDGAEDCKVDDQNIDKGSDIFISLPSMPRRFGCSRCSRCRVRSKGAFYCRAQMLHLFAPGWQEEDQTKLWQIPRGFLKWLRNEGPLEGCSTDQEAFDRALENPDVLDVFPWYNTVPTPEIIDLPIFPRKKSRTVEDENGGEAETKEDPAEAINPSEAPPPPAARGRDKPKLRKGKKKATLVLEPVQKKTSSAVNSTSLSSSFSLSSSKGNGGDRTFPREAASTGGARRNSTGASGASSTSGGRIARESWDGDSVGSGRKDTRDSDSDGDGEEAEKVVGTGGGDNDKGGGPGGRHRSLDRKAMGDLNEARRGSSPRAKGSDDGFRGGNGSARDHAQALAAAAGAPVAGVGRDHGLPQSAHGDKVDSVVKSGAATLLTGQRFDGENGQQERAKAAATEVILRSMPSEKAGDRARGSAVGGYSGRAGFSLRGGDCAEGVSGSTWKGIGSSAPRARSGSGIQGHQQQEEKDDEEDDEEKEVDDEGKEDDDEGKQDDDDEGKEDTEEEKKCRGNPSPPPEISNDNSNGNDSGDLTEGTRHDDQREKKKLDHARVQQAIAACDSRRAERQRYLEKKYEERRRARDEEALLTRRKRREDKGRRHTQEPPARKVVREVGKVKTNKDVKGRRAELAQRSAALARREQLAYWVKERPFLGKIPPQQANKRTPTPLVPQDLYRNALQEMQKLDERRQSSSATPTTTAAVAAASTPGATPGATDSSVLGLGWTPGVFGIGTAANTAATSAALAAWREETRQSLAAEWPAAAAAATVTVAGAEAEAAGVDQTGTDRRAPQLSRLKSGSSWRQRDLRGYLNRNEHVAIVDKTRSALKARVYYWTREFPTFVEQGGDILNAANEMPVDMSVIKATPDPEEWSAWVGRTLDNCKGTAPLTADDLPRNTMNSREPENDESENEDDSDNGSVGLPRELLEDELPPFLSRQQQRGASAVAECDGRDGDTDGNGDIVSGDDGGSDDEGGSGTGNISTADDSTDDVTLEGTLEGDKTKTVSCSGDDVSEDSSSGGVVGNDNSGGESDTEQHKIDEVSHKVREKFPAPGASPRSVGSLTTKANPAKGGEREGEMNNAVVVSDTVVPSATEIAVTPSLAGSAAGPSGEVNETAQRAPRSSPPLVPSASVEVAKPLAPAPSSVLAAEAAKVLPAPVDTAGSAGVNTTEAEGVSHTGPREVEPKDTAVERTGPKTIQKVSSISCEKVSVSDKDNSKEVSAYDKDKEVYAPGEESPVYGGNSETPATVQKDLSKEEGSGSMALAALPSKPSGLVEGVRARGAISVGSSRSVPEKKDPEAGGGGGGFGDGGGFRGEGGVEENLECLSARMMRSTKHFKISGSERLPPGWSVERDEKTDKAQGYWCRWYTYKKAGKSLRYKYLRDVESFVNSDDPEAARHRMAIMTGKIQDETWRPLMADEKSLADPSTDGTGAALSSVDGGSGGDARENRNSGRLSESLDETLKAVVAKGPLAGTALRSEEEEGVGELGGTSRSLEKERRKKKRKMEILPPSSQSKPRFQSQSEGGAKKTKLETKKPIADSSSPVWVGAGVVKGSVKAAAVLKRGRGRPPGSKNRPKDNFGPGDVKAQGKKTSAGVVTPGSTAGARTKSPGSKAGSGFIPPGSAGAKQSKPVGAKPPESQRAGAGGKLSGPTGARTPGVTNAKTPGSTSTKARESDAGAGGKASSSTWGKTPGLMSVETPGSGGVNVPGSTSAKTPTSASAKTPAPSSFSKASGSPDERSLGWKGIKAPGNKTGVNISDSVSAKASGSGGAKAPVKSGAGTKSPGSSSVAQVSRSAETPGSKNVETPGSTAGKTQGFEGAEASRPGGAKTQYSTNLKVTGSIAVKTPGLACVRGCGGSASPKTPALKAGAVSKAKDPKTGAGGHTSRSKASSETSKTSDAQGVTPEGSRPIGPEAMETPGPRGVGKTPTTLTSIKTLASKGTEGEGKKGDKLAEAKVAPGSEGAGSKEVEPLESRKATAAAEVPASSVSRSPDKDTTAPVSSCPTEGKPPREDSQLQETPRVSSKSEPSSPSGSDGDLVLGEAASILSKEMEGRGRKCSDEQHGKPSCVVPDSKDGGSSDGWSDGDTVIGEVGVGVEEGADAEEGDGSKGVAAGRTITTVAKNTEGVKKGTEGHVGDERELRLPEPPGAGAGGEKKEVAYSRGGLFARLDRREIMSDPAEVVKEGTHTPTARATNDGPVRRRKRRKSSSVVEPSGSSNGGGIGSRVSEVKEGEMEEKHKQERKSGSNSEAGAAEGGGGVNENGGRKMGKNMMKRVLALAAGAILPTGKRKRKAASTSGVACPTFPPLPTAAAGSAGSAGTPSYASSREGVKSVRRRRSTDDSSGSVRGADAGGGPSVARGGRDRGGASSGVSSKGSSGTVEGGEGEGGSSSSSSAAPLRQSSRAAAAAATAAMSGVFSSSS